MPNLLSRRRGQHKPVGLLQCCIEFLVEVQFIKEQLFSGLQMQNAHLVVGVVYLVARARFELATFGL